MADAPYTGPSTQTAGGLPPVQTHQSITAPYLSCSSPVEATISLHLPHYLFFTFFFARHEKKLKGGWRSHDNADGQRKDKRPDPLPILLAATTAHD